MAVEDKRSSAEPQHRYVVQLSLPLHVSRILQTILLCLILLLPGVDPTLATFIEWYLKTAAVRSTVDPESRPQPHGAAESTDESKTESCQSAVPEQPSPEANICSPPPTYRSTETGLPPVSVCEEVVLGASSSSVVASDLHTQSPDPAYPSPPVSNPPSGPSSCHLSPGSQRVSLDVSPTADTIDDCSTPAEPSQRVSKYHDDESALAEPTTLYKGPDTFTLLGTLGSGATGRVMYARDQDNNPLAIKVVHKPKMYRRRFGRVDVVAERNTLERITIYGKPFLTQLLSSWDDEENVYFVMRMYHENLLSRIFKGVIPMHDIKIYVAELIAALTNVHASGVFHRDIKPENILISPNGHLALGDFGLSHTNFTDNPDLGSCVLTDVVGTPGYWAPEVVTATPRSGYTYMADVWSMGMVIFEMYHALCKSYYDGHAVEDVVQDMMFNDVPLWTIEDAGLQDLLAKMLVRNPCRRCTAKELKNHPYFADIDWDLLAEGGYQPEYRPPFPDFNQVKKSIRFTSFHRGAGITDGRTVRFSSVGTVLPSGSVLRQMDEDRSDFCFRFRFRFPFGLVPSPLHDAPLAQEEDGSS